MAAATLLRHTDLAHMRHLLTTASILERTVSATQIDPAVALAVLALSHIGGNRIMALLETLLKPLLNAQREAGIEIGRARGRTEGAAEGEARARAEANAEFEAWKERQRNAGVHFVGDDDSADSPSVSDQ